MLAEVKTMLFISRRAAARARRILENALLPLIERIWTRITDDVFRAVADWLDGPRITLVPCRAGIIPPSFGKAPTGQWGARAKTRPTPWLFPQSSVLSPQSFIEGLEDRVLLSAYIVGNPTPYSTIQAAVNAAAPGATINVDAGTYPELVTITKKLALRGAQAGVDARSQTRTNGSAAESIITGTAVADGQSGSFYIAANDVTIDGFIVQGSTSNGTYGAGIVIAPQISGTHVLDNIVRNNVSGLFLANYSSTDAALIQHNFFYGNNNAGANGGRGIYTDGGISGGNLTNVTIDANAFINNHGTTNTTWYEAAIALESRTLGSQSNIRITNNMMDDNGKGVLAYNITGLSIIGNTVTYEQDHWSAAVRFEGGANNVTIQNNTVYDNTGPAVRIDSKGFDGSNSGFTITGNNFYGNDSYYGDHLSLYVASGQYNGTLNAQNNWWGSASGPGGDGTGSGDTVLANGNSVLFSGWSTSPPVPNNLPYWGIPATVGVPIQAEDYNHGGEGVAYHDTDAKNDGWQYRVGEGVDIGTISDTPGGWSGDYGVGWTLAGEWIDYTVSVPQGGAFNLKFRVGSDQSVLPSFHVEVDGQNVTGPISVPDSGSWSNWETITQGGVNISAGMHLFRIVFDTVGNSGAVMSFNWFEVDSTSAAAPPAAPTNLVAAAPAYNTVNLTWQDNSNNESGFNIERSTDGVNFTKIATTAANVASYSDTSVWPSTRYTYRVDATNLGGTSAYSNAAAVQTPAAPVVYLSDMSWVSATNGWGPVERDMSNGGQAAGDGHTLTLNGVTYAKGLGVNAISQIVYNLGGGYTNFLCDVGIDDEETVNGTVDFQVLADGVKLFDSGVMTPTSATQSFNLNVAGVQQLTLICGDAGDGPDYDHGDWAGARLIPSATPVVPVAPSNLAATAISASQINLAWQDNSANESGFKVQRSTDGVNFTTIATVPANTTSYSDSAGLAASTTYSYRVLATNTAGDSSPSNVASATTLSATAKTTYVSDMTWASATVGWGTIQKDLSIKGNPITLRASVYSKGIGTHAPSQIVYNLGGLYSSFISDVGIDDETNGQGSVDFQVLGDGKVLYDSGALTGSSPVAHINISVAGVQQLTLVANNGIPNNIDYDHADWAGARLISA